MLKATELFYSFTFYISYYQPFAMALISDTRLTALILSCMLISAGGGGPGNSSLVGLLFLIALIVVACAEEKDTTTDLVTPDADPVLLTMMPTVSASIADTLPSILVMLESFNLVHDVVLRQGD